MWVKSQKKYFSIKRLSMHIDITPENLLIQLGYPVNDAMMAQMERTLTSTKGFDTFSKHILSLKDEIALHDGYIALSNSRDALKIKSDAAQHEEAVAYRETLQKWSEKYKVDLLQVGDTNTFYILGQS
jgi:hypothetical protein